MDGGAQTARTIDSDADPDVDGAGRSGRNREGTRFRSRRLFDQALFHGGAASPRPVSEQARRDSAWDLPRGGGFEAQRREPRGDETKASAESYATRIYAARTTHEKCGPCSEPECDCGIGVGIRQRRDRKHGRGIRAPTTSESGYA